MISETIGQHFRCAHCGGEIPAQRVAAALTRGRSPRFCSDAHRAAEHNARSYLRRRGRDNPHVSVDRRSMAYHRLVAAKIESDPTLVVRARDNIARWRSMGQQETYLEEWSRILSRDTREIVRFLRSSGQRATRLRQSSPFTGVLSDEERTAILRAHR